MWFIGVEVEQETSVPHVKKNPGSAPVKPCPFVVYRKFLRLISFLLFLLSCVFDLGEFD